MSNTVVLPAKIDLSVATQVISDLRQTDGSIEIDAKDVTQLGALGLQALVAGSRAAHARGHAFQIINCSEKMHEHMEIMGVTQAQLEEGTL